MTPADEVPSPSPPPPSAEELRSELVRFARRLLELEDAGLLLSSPADLQTVLGELRRRLFAWEVRRTAELDAGTSSPGGVDSDQVVREAREARNALRRELGGDREDHPEGDDGETES
jgi:hypothetical protein